MYGWSNTFDSSSPLSMSAGKLCLNRCSAIAISASDFFRSGSPLTWKPPSDHSMSSGSISSRWAAARRAFSLILPAAPSTAPASITVVREPPGPVAGSPSRLPW